MTGAQRPAPGRSTRWPHGAAGPGTVALFALLLIVASGWSVREATRLAGQAEDARAARWWRATVADLTGPERAARITTLRPALPGLSAEPGQWADWVDAAAVALGLPLCRVVDGEGFVIASHHWPASLGIPLPAPKENAPGVLAEPLAGGRRPALITSWALPDTNGLRLVGGRFLDDRLFCPWPVRSASAAGRRMLQALPSLEGGDWYLTADALPGDGRPRLRLAIVPLGCIALAGVWVLVRARVARRRRDTLIRRLRALAPESIPPGAAFSLEDLDRWAREQIRRRAQLARRLRAARRLAGWRNAGRALAHEVRNALTPVRLRLEMASRRSGAAEPAATLRALATAEALLDEFTDFARLPRGAAQHIDLTEWLPQTLARWLPDRTPSVDLPGGNLVIEADPARLERAVGNLLRNAREAAAGAQLRVACAVIETGEKAAGAESSASAPVEQSAAAVSAAPRRVRISVWNPGAPIPDSLGARIFIEGTTTKPSGSGLGLAIARSIALQLGGNLSYRNVSGGVAFDLTLPLASDRA